MKSTTILALVLGFQLAVVHIVATKLSLYWEIIWFDNLVHLFGGVVLVLIFYTLVDIKILSPKWVRSARRSALLVTVVLVGWEILGVMMIGRIKENSVSDTSLDILFGILGCIIGWCIGRQLKKLE